MRIDQTNYESFLLSYIDGELTETEKQEVESFCAGNPEAAREFALLQQTVLTPALAVFENKASLYREEEKRRVIGWYLWRAAVVLVLLAGGAFLYRTWQPASGGKNENDHLAAVNKDGQREKDRNDSGDVSNTGISSAAKNTGVAAGGDKPSVSGRKDHTVKALDSTSASGNKNLAVMKAPGTVKRSVEPGKEARETATVSPVQQKGSRAAEEKNQEEEFLPAAARTTAIDVVAVHITGNAVGNREMTPVDKNPGQLIAANSGRSMTRNPAPVNDGPADSEGPAFTGDDAVSILHLAKSGSVVGKLFHRLSAGKNSDQPGNSGDKKVNISVFQFAVGK